jgi:hypothetical protein
MATEPDSPLLLPGLPYQGTLALLGTTTLTPPPATAASGSKTLLACNPAIDLVAAAGAAGGELHVRRAGDDQLVSRHVERGGRRVEAVRWKEDGTFTLLSF